MKKIIKILFMILMGVMLMPTGIWLNNWDMANQYTMPPYAMVNLVCLVLWLNISFLIKNETISTKTIVICMNIVPVIVFLLHVYYHFVLHTYEGTLGMYMQLYFRPIIWINLRIFNFTRSVISMYLNSVLTLTLCSFIGCKTKEGFMRLKEAWS